MLDGEGQKVDWVVGYEPPPDRFLAKLEKAVRGVDTYRVLSDRYAKEPNNPEAAFRLALKYREDLSQKDKTVALFRQVRSADATATSGPIEVEGFGVEASLREYAEYFLAELEPRANGAAMRAFLTKYPQSALLKAAYGFLSRFYLSRNVIEDDAAAFFEKYMALFPDDLDPLAAYLGRIRRNGGPLNTGRKIATRMRALAGQNLSPAQALGIALFYVNTGDEESAFDVFGRDFLDPRTTPEPDLLARGALFWLSRTSHHGDALKMIERALALDPASPNVRRSAASAYLLAGLKDMALNVYGPDFAEALRDKPTVLSAYAQFWTRQRTNLSSAADAASRSVELEPDARTYDTLALILFLQRRYEDALGAAEKAVSLARESESPFGRNLVSQFEVRLKQIKEAVEKGKNTAGAARKLPSLSHRPDSP